ncbi:MAG TPA: hypothetical protein VM253_02335 [Candidatus Limnocylindrales bacterium]|nr:hypothetical protein [Candidatus Limnocylindrales bacterium]
MTRFAALLLGALVLATACVTDTRPDAELCGRRAIELELALTADALDPANVAVCRDQEVTLHVDSEVDGILHIHGYDSEVPAFAVSPGEVADITFTAGRSGQFPVEFHASDDPTGVAVGIFTVHEP